jgi:hypothetical protein
MEAARPVRFADVAAVPRSSGTTACVTACPLCARAARRQTPPESVSADRRSASGPRRRAQEDGVAKQLVTVQMGTERCLPPKNVPDYNPTPLRLLPARARAQAAVEHFLHRARQTGARSSAGPRPTSSRWLPASPVPQLSPADPPESPRSRHFAAAARELPPPPGSGSPARLP